MFFKISLGILWMLTAWKTMFEPYNFFFFFFFQFLHLYFIYYKYRTYYYKFTISQNNEMQSCLLLSLPFLIVRGVIRKFAEKYYHSFISHAILIKFAWHTARFNSSKMTNLYPNRANNEKVTVSMVTSLHGTRPKTFLRRRNFTYFST